MTKDEIEKKIVEDPLFRIHDAGFYHILTKELINHKKINRWKVFDPFPHQRLLNEKIVRFGWQKVLIPKARRMGFSTDINILQLDSCQFRKDFHSRIVDQKEEDASDKLVNRVQRAAMWLESNVKGMPKITTQSKGEIKWDNGSRFTSSVSGRGGDAVHFLHISELGPIDFKDPKRADEIIDGALPTADGGITVIESTAKGPLGHFKRLCDEANEIPEEEKTEEHWRVLFYAWFLDPRHVRLGKFSHVSKDTNEYLDYVESKVKGLKLSEEQRIWYHFKKAESSVVKYEYPSLYEECWEAPVEGAIYASQINAARDDGRIRPFPINRGVAVNSIWDLGAPENTRCILFQQIMGEIHIVAAIKGGFDEDAGTNIRFPSDWAHLLRSQEFSYGSHVMPHDANQTGKGGKTFKRMMEEAGVNNIRVMPRENKAAWNRINETNTQFNRFVFNKDGLGVEELLKHLESYCTQKTNDGSVKEEPGPKWASHYADAFGDIIRSIDTGKAITDAVLDKRKRGVNMVRYRGRKRERDTR